MLKSFQIVDISHNRKLVKKLKSLRAKAIDRRETRVFHTFYKVVYILKKSSRSPYKAIILQKYFIYLKLVENQPDFI